MFIEFELSFEACFTATTLSGLHQQTPMFM